MYESGWSMTEAFQSSADQALRDAPRASAEPRTPSRERRAAIVEPRTPSRERRAANDEPRAPSRERRAANDEPATVRQVAWFAALTGAFPARRKQSRDSRSKISIRVRQKCIFSPQNVL